MKKIAHLGVDYHVKTVTITVYLNNEGFYETVRFNNSDKTIAKYLKKLSRKFEIKLCYEASSSGYVFQRKMDKLGYHCDVIAPSLIPRKPGDKRKNDHRDSKKLAENYAKGLLTVVHPPTESEESIRGLVRCHLAMKNNEKRIKNQINAYLLSKGHRWPKSKWTLGHLKWLSTLELCDEYSQMVLEEYLGHLEYITTRVQALKQEIEKLANSEIYAPSVKKLRAFKGIGTMTAMLLIVEITDFRRFPTAGALMAYLGLIPGEESSDSRSKDKAITKAGNTRCRKAIIGAIQHYMRQPRITAPMQRDLGKVDARSANMAIKCMKRLNKRFWALIHKGKTPNKAKVAVARELAGFVWAMMQPEPTTI